MDANFSFSNNNSNWNLSRNLTTTGNLTASKAIIFKYAFSIALILAFALANYVVVYAIFKSPQLRNRSNILAASLIVSDAIYGLYATINLIVQAYVMFVEGKICTVVLGIIIPINNLFIQALNGHLLSIAIDRYIAIVHPFFYNTKLIDDTTKFFIIGSWMYGVLVAIIHAQNMRLIDWNTCTTPYSILLTNVTDMSSYLLIAVTIVVIYGRILLVAMQQQSKIEAIMTTTGVIQTGNDTTSHPSGTRGEFKAARMTAMILGCYILLWIPYYFGRICQACGNTKPYVDYLIQIGWPVGHLNTAMNWIIYGVHNKSFRETIIRMFKRGTGTRNGV